MRNGIDQTLAALADPTRRAVVDLLRRAPMRSGTLAKRLDRSRPAMSRHLRVLRQARVVEEEADSGDARGRLYQLRRAPLVALRSWLAEVELRGHSATQGPSVAVSTSFASASR